MKAPLPKNQRFLFILVLGLLSAISPFTIDTYLPGFPLIAKQLGTSIENVTFSLSIYFIGICVGQLFYGPILDTFGRRKPLIFGMVVYIIASFGCALSPNIETLIVCRFFQAVGGCVAIVGSRAIVRDVFPVSETAKIFSLLILILGVSPLLAPTIGSFILRNFDWHYIFIFLGFLGTLILLSYIFTFKETAPQNTPKKKFNFKNSISGYGVVFQDPIFKKYGLTSAATAAGMYAYLAGSSTVFQEQFLLSKEAYGYLFAVISGGLIAASQLNNLLLKKHNSASILKVSVLIQMIVGITMVSLASVQLLNFELTAGLLFLYLCCQGISFPNASALSLSPFTNNVGSAAALMGGLQMALGAFASALVSILPFNTLTNMCLAMALLASCGLLCLKFVGTKPQELKKNKQ